MTFRRSLGTDYAVPAAALGCAVAIYLASRGGMRLHACLDPHGALQLDAVHLARVPAWVRFNLPDGLWQLAFCYVLFRTWGGAGPRLRRWAWCASPVLVGCGSEIAQALGVLEGVYDPWDLVAMAVGAAAAFLLARARCGAVPSPGHLHGRP